MTGVSVSVIVLSLCVVVVTGQADLNHSMTMDKLPIRDKAIYLADYLMKHPVLFGQIEKIFYASKPIQEQGSKGPGGKLLLNAALDYMPLLLQSPDFLADLSILEDEINRVNLTDVMMYQQSHNLNTSDPQMKKMFSQAMLARVNKLRTIRRILMRKSFQDRLVRHKNDSVSDQCYAETMDFMDGLVGIQIPDKSNPFNFKTLPWAIKMFDAMGKPRGGITKGNLYFIGQYDLCMSTHAHVPANIIIGNRMRTKSRDFDTKFCRVSFNLPNSLVKAVTGDIDTRGVTLRINWGFCLPSSCTKEDVHGLVALGPLASVNLNESIHSVYCAQNIHLVDDGSALATSIILGAFVCIVLFTTVVEGVSVWFRANCRTEDCESVNVTEHIELEGVCNAGFVSDENNGSLPSGYVRHRNDKGLPEHEYSSLSKHDTSETKISLPEPKIIGDPVVNGGQSSVPKLEASRRSPTPSVGLLLIKAFSLYNNVPKLLNCKKSPSAIHCIHGIRFFSIMWIILGHTYNYGVISVLDTPTTANLVDVDELMKRFSFQVVQAGGYAVDTFFMISGMLVTWLLLKDLAKRKLSAGFMGQFFFHRFWRLTPIYMFVLAGFGCLYEYLGSGPLWPEAIKAADICKTNWWTNMLYINNIVRVDDMCMGWSWYLSNDMQFYIISPLLVIPMYLYAPLGISLTFFLMFSGIASAFYKEYLYGGDLFQKTDTHYWNDVYIAPWCRVSTWCVGMILGYIMHKYKNTKLKQTHVLVGWIIAIGTGLTLTYITYDYRKEGGTPWPRWGMAAMESFGRPLWAASVAWVVYACHKGRGAIINSILSFGGLIPLSRLTYAAYLVHPVMMIIYVFSKRTLLYISDYDIAYLFIGHVCTTFMAAFVLSMVFESPFLTLEKILFRRGHRD